MKTIALLFLTAAAAFCQPSVKYQNLQPNCDQISRQMRFSLIDVPGGRRSETMARRSAS